MQQNYSNLTASNMNMRGVFLHVLADALGSVVVIISAVIMWKTEWQYKKYVDPGLSLVLVLLMMKGVWPLLIESALILLQVRLLRLVPLGLVPLTDTKIINNRRHWCQVGRLFHLRG